jgi:hypothetical protein
MAQKKDQEQLEGQELLIPDQLLPAQAPAMPRPTGEGARAARPLWLVEFDDGRRELYRTLKAANAVAKSYRGTTTITPILVGDGPSTHRRAS